MVQNNCSRKILALKGLWVSSAYPFNWCLLIWFPNTTKLRFCLVADAQYVCRNFIIIWLTGICTWNFPEAIQRVWKGVVYIGCYMDRGFLLEVNYKYKVNEWQKKRRSLCIWHLQGSVDSNGKISTFLCLCFILNRGLLLMVIKML